MKPIIRIKDSFQAKSQSFYFLRRGKREEKLFPVARGKIEIT